MAKLTNAILLFLTVITMILFVSSASAALFANVSGNWVVSGGHSNSLGGWKINITNPYGMIVYNTTRWNLSPFTNAYIYDSTKTVQLTTAPILSTGTATFPRIFQLNYGIYYIVGNDSVASTNRYFPNNNFTPISYTGFKIINGSENSVPSVDHINPWDLMSISYDIQPTVITTLNSPINQANYSLTLDSSFILLNETSYTYNANDTFTNVNTTFSVYNATDSTLLNQTLIASVTNTTTILMNLTYGDYYWNAQACASNATNTFCSSSALFGNNYFSNRPYLITNNIYNATAVRLTNQSYLLSFNTTSDVVAVSANLIYNNTVYQANVINSGINYNISTSLVMPDTNSILTNNFSWSISVNLSNGQTLNYNTYNTTQLIYPIMGTPITSGPIVLQTPGTYFLANNITCASVIGLGCITINSSNVILDGLGYAGSVSTGTTNSFIRVGTLLANPTKDNVTIQNFVFTNTTAAASFNVIIFVENVSNILIQNNRIIDAASGTGTQFVGYMGTTSTSFWNVSVLNNTAARWRQTSLSGFIDIGFSSTTTTNVLDGINIIGNSFSDITTAASTVSIISIGGTPINTIPATRVSNINIENNTFSGAYTNILVGSGSAATSGYGSNIIIKNNIFNTYTNPTLTTKSLYTFAYIDNVSITNNIYNTRNISLSNIQRSSNIYFYNNTYNITSLASNANPGIFIFNNTQGITLDSNTLTIPSVTVGNVIINTLLFRFNNSNIHISNNNITGSVLFGGVNDVILNNNYFSNTVYPAISIIYNNFGQPTNFYSSSNNFLNTTFDYVLSNNLGNNITLNENNIKLQAVFFNLSTTAERTNPNSLISINFTLPVSFSNKDYSSAIQLAQTSAYINSVNYPELNKPARISLFNSFFINPIVYRDNSYCFESICSPSYGPLLQNANPSFTVQSWSNYTIGESNLNSSFMYGLLNYYGFNNNLIDTVASNNLTTNIGTTCYQESVNVINQTGIDGGVNCNLTYTGSYSYNFTWQNVGRLYDGNWSTYSLTQLTPPNVASFFINYTAPYGVLNSSLWKIKTSAGDYNVSIPSSCFNNNELRFRADSSVYFNGILGYCWSNTNSWVQIINLAGTGYWFYEEAMIWQIQDVNFISGGLGGTKMVNTNNASFYSLSNISLINDGTSRTVNFWSQLSIFSIYQVLVQLGTSSNNNSFAIGTDNNKWMLQENPANTTFGTADTSWHMHTITYNNHTTEYSISTYPRGTYLNDLVIAGSTFGVKFTVNKNSILHSTQMANGANATDCYLTDSSRNILTKNTNVVTGYGDWCNFSAYPLVAGTTYYMLTNASGPYQRGYISSASYPYTNEYINFTTGWNGVADTSTNRYAIRNITTYVVTGTGNDNELIWYIDGVNQSTILPAYYNTSINLLTINPTGANFTIDELGIWNRAFNTTEVQTFYNGAKGTLFSNGGFYPGNGTPSITSTSPNASFSINKIVSGITNFIIGASDNIGLSNATLTISHNITNYCYQESTNTTNQTGIDGSCGLIYSGNYVIASSTITSNYIKPSGASGGIWRVKGGGAVESNLTIPSDCWNYSTTNISLQTYSNRGGPDTQYFSCWNGTAYKNLTYTTGGNVGCGPSGDNGLQFIDGDWNTRTMWNSGDSSWKGSQCGTQAADIYEEAMYWEVSPLTVIINQTSVDMGGLLQSTVSVPIALVDGIYNWFWSIFNIGSYNTQTSQDNLLLVGTYPNISFVSPTLVNYANITNTTSTITIPFYINVSSNSVNVSLYIYNNSNLINSTTVNISNVTNVNINLTIPVNNQYYYNYYFNASASEPYAGFTSWTETRQFTVDSNAPIITIINPNSTITNQTITNFTININDNQIAGNKKLINITDPAHTNRTDLFRQIISGIIVMNNCTNEIRVKTAEGIEVPSYAYNVNSTACDVGFIYSINSNDVEKDYYVYYNNPNVTTYPNYSTYLSVSSSIMQKPIVSGINYSSGWLSNTDINNNGAGWKIYANETITLYNITIQQQPNNYTYAYILNSSKSILYSRQVLDNIAIFSNQNELITLPSGNIYYLVMNTTTANAVSYDTFDNSNNRLLNNLKYYYTLDETSGVNIVDRNSGINNGTSDGTTGITYGSPGILNNSLRLNGLTNGGVNMTSTFGTNMTLSFWMNLASYPPSSVNYIWSYSFSGSAEILARINATNLDFYGYQGAGHQYRFVGPLPALNTWNHYVVQFTNDGTGQARLWINGVLFSTDNSVILNIPSVINNRIGYSSYYTLPAINGMLDEFALWSDYLNDSQITYLYNNSVTHYYNNVALPSTSNGITILNGSNSSNPSQDSNNLWDINGIGYSYNINYTVNNVLKNYDYNFTIFGGNQKGLYSNVSASLSSNIFSSNHYWWNTNFNSIYSIDLLESNPVWVKYSLTNMYGNFNVTFYNGLPFWRYSDISGFNETNSGITTTNTSFFAWPSSLSQSLVAYYKMDDTIANTPYLIDSYLGLHNSSTVTTTNVARGVSGKINNSYFFNGTNGNNGIVNIPLASMPEVKYLNTTNNLSISFWVKMANNPTGVIYYVGEARGSGSFYFKTYPNGTLGFVLYTGTNKELYYPGPMGDNTWKFFTGTWDGTTQNLYYNGNLYATRNNAGTSIAYNSFSQNFTLGNYQDSGSIGLNGYLDEVGIWNRSLTANEVKTLYYGNLGSTINNYTISNPICLGYRDNLGNYQDNCTNINDVRITSGYVDMYSTDNISTFAIMSNSSNSLFNWAGFTSNTAEPQFSYPASSYLSNTGNLNSMTNWVEGILNISIPGARENMYLSTTNPVSIMIGNQTIPTEGAVGLNNATLTISKNNTIINQTTVNIGGLIQTTVAIPVSLVDGFYNWFWSVFDLLGNNAQTTTQNLTVSITNPGINFTYPTSNSGVQNYNSIWGNLSINTTDFGYNNNTIILSLIGINSSNVTTNITNALGSLYYNFTGLSDGNYNLTGYVTDTAGSTNQTETRQILIDLYAPNITPLTPGTFSDDNFTNFTANISDNHGIQNATITVTNNTGSLVNQTTVTLGGVLQSIVSVPIALVEGAYTWFWKAFDIAGNQATTTNQSTIVDFTLPKIIVYYPVNGANYTYIVTNLTANIFEETRDNLTIKLNSDPEILLANLTFYNSTYLLFNPLNQSNSTFTIYNISATQGTNNWTLYYTGHSAVDIPAKIANQTIFFVDSVKPLVSFVSPTDQNNSYINRTNIIYNVTAYDTNLKNLTVYLYNSTGSIIQTNIVSPITANTTSYGTFSGLSDVDYSFNAVACDTLGNCNTTQSNLIHVDSSYPVITFVNGNQTLNANTLVTAYDLTAIWANISATNRYLTNLTLSLIGNNNGINFSNTQNISNLLINQTSLSYNWTGLIDGNYTINGTATNIAGLTSRVGRQIFITGNAPTNMSYQSPTILDGYTAETYIPVNVSLYEPNIRNITINLYSLNSTNSTVLVASAASGSYAQNFYNAFSVPDGLYQFNATAYDIYNHSTSLPTYNITKSFTTVLTCRNLSIPGLYVLNNNLNSSTGPCLTVTVPNVMIDCRGYSIIVGTGSAVLTNQTGTTIKNCYIDNIGPAVNITGGTTTIQNSTLTNSTYGIYIINGQVTVLNTTISDNTWGIYLTGSSRASFNTDTFTSNTYGIYHENAITYPGYNSGWVSLPPSASTYNNIAFTGSATDVITLVNSSYNVFNYITSSNAGGIRYSNSSNNQMTSSDLDSAVVTLVNTSRSNVFLDTNYSSDSVDNTSQLTRSWTTTVHVVDSHGSGVGGTTVHANDGSTNTTIGTDSSGNGQGIISSYINNGTITIFNPYNIFGVLTDYGSTLYTLIVPASINQPTTVTLTFAEQIKSTLLTRQVGQILMAMILLIGLAASTGFFIVKMRNGESVADIWKYFIIMIIWDTLFLVLFAVMSGFIMRFFYIT